LKVLPSRSDPFGKGTPSWNNLGKGESCLPDEARFSGRRRVTPTVQSSRRPVPKLLFGKAGPSRQEDCRISNCQLRIEGRLEKVEPSYSLEVNAAVEWGVRFRQKMVLSRLSTALSGFMQLNHRGNSHG
jgi:hypothetical protein